MSTTDVLEYSARNNPDGGGWVLALPLDQIAPFTLNPRSEFDPDALQELANDIKARGQDTPVIVRLARSGLGVPYELIAGERRLRACRLAGLTMILAINRGDVSDREAVAIATAENAHRINLNPLEQARNIEFLLSYGHTQEEAGKLLGMSQEAVSHTRGLLRLPGTVQEMLKDGRLSKSHAKTLARFLAFPQIAERIALIAAENDIPAKQLEREKVPFSSSLQQAGLVKSLYAYSTPFDVSQCEECPYQAYRNDHGVKLCLNPEHYEELRAAAVAEREQEQRERLERLKQEPGPKAQAVTEKVATASGEEPGGLPDLTKLPHGDWAELGQDRPEGCSGECPCFVTAKTYGGRIISACLDPGRLNSLKSKQSKLQTAARKERFAALLSEVETVPEQDSERLERAMAMVLWEALRGTKMEARRVVVERVASMQHPPDGWAPVAELLRNPSYTRHEREAWEALAGVQQVPMLHLAAEILVRHELAEKLEYKSDDTRRTNFLLGRAPAPEEAAELAVEPCEGCGNDFHPEDLQDVEGRRLCVACEEDASAVEEAA